MSSEGFVQGQECAIRIVSRAGCTRVRNQTPSKWRHSLCRSSRSMTPALLCCSLWQVLEPGGLYLLENGQDAVLYFDKAINQELLQVGVTAAAQPARWDLPWRDHRQSMGALFVVSRRPGVHGGSGEASGHWPGCGLGLCHGGMGGCTRSQPDVALACIAPLRQTWVVRYICAHLLPHPAEILIGWNPAGQCSTNLDLPVE